MEEKTYFPDVFFWKEKDGMFGASTIVVGQNHNQKVEIKYSDRMLLDKEELSDTDKLEWTKSILRYAYMIFLFNLHGDGSNKNTEVSRVSDLIKSKTK